MFGGKAGFDAVGAVSARKSSLKWSVGVERAQTGYLMSASYADALMFAIRFDLTLSKDLYKAAE